MGFDTAALVERRSWRLAGNLRKVIRRLDFCVGSSWVVAQKVSLLVSLDVEEGDQKGSGLAKKRFGSRVARQVWPGPGPNQLFRNGSFGL